MPSFMWFGVGLGGMFGGLLFQSIQSSTVNWFDWGLAGLFAVYSLILFKNFNDVVDKLQKGFSERTEALTKTQETIQVALVDVHEALELLIHSIEAHDTRVTSTMEVMSRFLDINALVDSAPAKRGGGKS